jgi:DNA-binding GntR family transcriptional regulator
MCSVLYIKSNLMSTTSFDLPEVRRTGLREQVRTFIRTAIVTGEVKPGETYTVGAIARRVGVSATPVREAVLDLANEGLIEVLPNRGFRVPELTERDLDELFQLRLFLEGGALEALVHELTAEDLARFTTTAEMIVDFAADGDLSSFLSTDREFHLGLLATLGNHRLVELVATLRDQTRLYGMPALALHGSLVSAAREHLDILDALRVKDKDGIRQAMTKHLRHTRGLWAGQTE